MECGAAIADDATSCKNCGSSSGVGTEDVYAPSSVAQKNGENSGEERDVENNAVSAKNIETTDIWPFWKILKHTLLPKPKGAPKAGKKEIAVRIGMASIIATALYFLHFKETPLPECEQSGTKKLIEKIINDNPAIKARNIKYVSLKEISEQGYNKTAELRSCQATLVTTVGEDSIQYSVKWQDKNKKLYFVEMQVLQTSQVDDEINQQVADDAVRQFEIARRNGTAMDVCLQAMGVSAAYLQANNEPKYAQWKIIEKQACRSAGMPGY